MPANISRHWFEEAFHRADGPAHWANAKLVRSADDFVILARSQGRQLIDWVESQLEDRFRLTINREKTRVVNWNEAGPRLDFLGFTFRYDRDLKGRGHRDLNVFPSTKALARARQVVQTMTDRSRCFLPIPVLIGDVNRRLQSWSRYFQQGYPRAAFRRLNWFVLGRLRGQLHHRRQRPFRPPEGTTLYTHLQALGWQPL